MPLKAPARSGYIINSLNSLYGYSENFLRSQFVAHVSLYSGDIAESSRENAYIIDCSCDLHGLGDVADFGLCFGDLV